MSDIHAEHLANCMLGLARMACLAMVVAIGIVALFRTR